MFAQFSGVVDDQYTSEELRFYLYALHLCYGQGIREEDGRRFISFQGAQIVSSALFGEDVEQLSEKIELVREDER
jgi:hypothetical protein